MSPATGKVLTSALLAVSWLNSANALAEEAFSPRPVTPASQDLDTGSLDPDAFKVALIKNDLITRYERLERFYQKEINSNFNFLSIRRPLQAGYRRLQIECQESIEALGQVNSLTDAECVASVLKPAIKENEERAAKKGYLNPDAISVIRKDFADSGYLLRDRFYDEKSEDPKLSKVVTYNPDGSILFSASLSENTVEYRSGNGERLASVTFDDEGAILSRCMYDLKGKAYGTFRHEKARNPSLTEDEHLTFLATNLNTFGKIDFYLRLMLDYENAGHGNIQTVEDTLNRGVGNCLAFSFLTAQILEKQGYAPYIVSMKKIHAACYVFDYRDGSFSATSFCNWGVDTNGNRYGFSFDEEKARGFRSLREAINSTLVKYNTRRFEKLDGGVYQVDDSIRILSFKKPEEPGGKNKMYTLLRLAELSDLKSAG